MLIDEGEAEAIALAYQLNTIIILDDEKARKVAPNPIDIVFNKLLCI